MSETIQTIHQAILEGDQSATVEAIEAALQAGSSPAQLLGEAMIPAMNEVGRLFEGGGFEVHDLGVDVPAEKFLQAVLERQPDILGLSALLTTTMTNMKVIIDALIEAGLRGQVKVIVGGAPLNDEFASQIGADGFASDASRAV